MPRPDYIFAALVLFGIFPNEASGQSKFDGIWSILVTTKQGDCDKAYKYVVKMENGKVKYGGEGKFTVDGSISDNGKVSGTIFRTNSAKPGEPSRADFKGNLAINSGSGTWTGTSHGGCSGYWDANRGATLGMIISQ